MRRALLALLASLLWVACGGSDQNPFGDTPDANGGHGGSSGAAGRSSGGSGGRGTSSTTGTSVGGGGATGGRAGTSGAAGSGGARDASPDVEVDALDGAPVDSSPAGAGGVGGAGGSSAGGAGGSSATGGGGSMGGSGAVDAGMGGGGSDAGPDVSTGGSTADAGDARVDSRPECSGANQCPQPPGECSRATCVDGGCGTASVAAGTSLSSQVAGDCKRKVCDGNGGTTEQNDDADVADDSNACTLDGCSSGSPTHVAQPGHACGTNGLCNVNGQCVGCISAADCPGTDDFCKVRTCGVGGTCGWSFTMQGTALPANQQIASDCKRKVCDGNGNVVTQNDNADIADDSNACTLDSCSNGTPTHVPQTGQACSFSGGNICDGSGACVECLQPSDCGTPANAPCLVATCSTDHHCGTANAPPTTDCGQGPSCNSNIAHAQDKCSGGTCVSGGDKMCSRFVCGGTTCTTSCTDDLGCWTNFQCDTDLADCIPDGLPTCTHYCYIIQAACVGANQQYPSNAECLHSCAGLPHDATMSGNTTGCRDTHAGYALGSDANAAAHCPHAGPAGDGVCGTNCESFCSLASTTCVGGNQQFTDPTDCATKCAVFANSTARYTIPSVDADTFACRMYHLTLATIDPVTHCPHIRPVSDVCHN